MKIVCLTTFLDGRDRYEEGDTRTVSDKDGQRFIKNGWASAEGPTQAALPNTDPADLVVHNAASGVTDKKGA